MPRVVEDAQPVETEVAILEAARDLLAEGGLNALSMRAVASRVGVSATAIYNYFESKQELVGRVVEQGFGRFEAYWRQAAVEAPEGSRERLYSLGEAYIRFALENREYFRILFAGHAPAAREIEAHPVGTGYQLFRQAVVDAMEAGTIRRDDPDLVVLYLWTLVHGLVTLLLACGPDARCRHTGEELDALDLLGRFRDLVRNGLKPTAASELELEAS